MFTSKSIESTTLFFINSLTQKTEGERGELFKQSNFQRKFARICSLLSQNIFTFGLNYKIMFIKLTSGFKGWIQVTGENIDVPCAQK